MSAVLRPANAEVRLRLHWTDRFAQAAIVGIVGALLLFLAAPLGAILMQSVEGADGRWVGLANFIAYAQTPTLLQSLWNSVWVSSLVTVLTVPLAFGFAYALTRSCMPLKGLFRAITLVPLLAPSLLSAISLIYWFGNQGVLTAWMRALGIDQIYGAPGIVVAECLAVFPHALMILVSALTLADARLYEAADAMGTSAPRKFFTITLPGAKYGLISAALVTFTLVITDFGIPKVIGGNFNVLATDVFKLVIGQQDFAKGAVVAILLLLPAVITFAVDHRVQRKQTAMLTARAVPFRPAPARGFDAAMTAYCCVIALLMLAMLGMAVFASFATFWPYNLAPSFKHYIYGLVDNEVASGFVNSLQLAAGTALFGTAIVFIGAYLQEKTRGLATLRGVLRLLAILPMAVPGLVLGLGYIFFFNEPHRGALLHHWPPHCGDGAEGAGCRIRVGVDVAQGAVLQNLLARHAADLHAGPGGHCALLLHQRDDHHLGRGLFVLGRYAAGVDRHPQHGRSRRVEPGRRNGGADCGRLSARHGAVHAAGLVDRPAHASVAHRLPLTRSETTMDRDSILLTPGPLTTTLRTKLAMLRDWGSWDADFNAKTAELRRELLAIVHGDGSHVVVPLQGSGTFAVEAAVATVVPRNGHVLVLDNGAYCKRLGKLATLMGRRTTIAERAEDDAVSPDELDALLRQDPSITHVGLIHCETGTGVLNPLQAVSDVCKRHGKGLIVDAMSSFAALHIDSRTVTFDALIAASGKCLEGVPGMGFVFIRKAVLDRCAGNSHSLAMDLHDQHAYMEKTGQWRFTPPTHVMVALLEAVRQFVEAGGQPARLARYTDNCRVLTDGMAALGFKPFLPPALQAPIIVTFHAPADPHYEFKAFYAAAKRRGFILYPGKLTQLETFRVGCIGAIGRNEMQQAVNVVAEALREMGISSGAPAR
jgi:iron(III) transport system permease protein